MRVDCIHDIEVCLVTQLARQDVNWCPIWRKLWKNISISHWNIQPTYFFSYCIAPSPCMDHNGFQCDFCISLVLCCASTCHDTRWADLSTGIYRQWLNCKFSVSQCTANTPSKIGFLYEPTPKSVWPYKHV